MFDQYEPSSRLELLRESMNVYFRFLQENPQLVRILAWMFLEQDQETCIERNRQLVEIGTGQLKQGQKDGVEMRNNKKEMVAETNK